MQELSDAQGMLLFKYPCRNAHRYLTRFNPQTKPTLLESSFPTQRQLSYLISIVSDSLSVSWLFPNKCLILVNRRPLCNVGSFLTFWGSNGLFLGLGKGSNSVLGSTHVVEQLSFSMLSSILTFDFCLVWGNYFQFLGT